MSGRRVSDDAIAAAEKRLAIQAQK